MSERAPDRFSFEYWNTTIWLTLQICIARFLAWIPAQIFTSSFVAILVRLKYLAPEAPPTPAPFLELSFPLAAGSALLLVEIAAPVAWSWPIGRYLDTRDEGLRARALDRFARLDRFFLLFIALEYAADALAPAWRSLRGGAPLRETLAAIGTRAFAGYYSYYLTMLVLEPMLFKGLAQWLHPGETVFEAKEGPMWTVRKKLLLLVANLVVIPMALAGASMSLGLTGFTQGMGVVVLTSVLAIGYMEMLYRNIAHPLAELVAKMARVSRGDYTAKTSVLAGDEIGRLKAHYNEMVDGLEERERLKDTFGRYVSVEIAKHLIESKQVSLGGQSVEATVLYTDIRGFTPLSESMAPQELVAFLNRYLSFITQPIAEHRGVVNKFIGDAVMAVFTPQFGSTDHATDALEAALSMRRKLAEFNEERPAGKQVRFGIGVHTGQLVAGNIGTEKRMEYTVIGDTVNTTARIESKTKDLACDLLISEAVFVKLGPEAKAKIAAERVEDVRVKGKEAALVLYKIG
ncbi:MAG: adenylate/guanylate cyclase domain-containing protein [Proteobacteria bacterium]|nr:adenylate/guanylate cyclase domain-containing protein [Pseudomonadota bacterium]